MHIHLDNIGKRFGRDWIFRHMDLRIEPGSTLIKGGNGTGKSTLLSIVSGFGTASEGDISYTNQGKDIPREHIYKEVSICAPYLELYEEFTLSETLNQHQKLKPFDFGLNTELLAERMNLTAHIRKQVKFFSSGMKQRVKLSLALASKSQILLLDEPGSNLDDEGMKWYRSMIDQYATGKTVVVFSVGESDENEFCLSRHAMESFK